MDYVESAISRREPRLVREDAEHPLLLEISDLNPLAQRRPGGIWNEHILPATEWEAAGHRVVIPHTLQVVLGFETPVLRWNRRKRQQVLRKHHRDHVIIVALDHHLAGWQFAGVEIENPRNYQVLFRVIDRWYAVSIGVDKTGSHNLITIFGSNKPSFANNRLRGLMSVVEREK